MFALGCESPDRTAARPVRCANDLRHECAFVSPDRAQCESTRATLRRSDGECDTAGKTLESFREITRKPIVQTIRQPDSCEVFAPNQFLFECFRQPGPVWIKGLRLKAGCGLAGLLRA